MKKKFLTLCLAALTLAGFTSCSADDDLADTGTSGKSLSESPIIFTASRDRSRADAETLTDLDSFTAWAARSPSSGNTDYVFRDTEFKWDAEERDYRCSAKPVWPDSGNLDFFACNVPYIMGGIQDNPNMVLFVQSDWDGTRDAVVAYAFNVSKQDKVPLNFKHITAKVSVGLSIAPQPNVSCKVRSVVMYAPNQLMYSATPTSETFASSNYDNSHGKYVFYEEDSSVDWEFEMDESHPNEDCQDCSYNIAPQADKIVFEVEYETYFSGVKQHDFTGSNKKTLTIDNPDLEPGKTYQFDLRLSDGTVDQGPVKVGKIRWGTEDLQYALPVDYDGEKITMFDPAFKPSEGGGGKEYYTVKYGNYTWEYPSVADFEELYKTATSYENNSSFINFTLPDGRVMWFDSGLYMTRDYEQDYFGQGYDSPILYDVYRKEARPLRQSDFEINVSGTYTLRTHILHRGITYDDD